MTPASLSLPAPATHVAARLGCPPQGSPTSTVPSLATPPRSAGQVALTHPLGAAIPVSSPLPLTPTLPGSSGVPTIPGCLVTSPTVSSSNWARTERRRPPVSRWMVSGDGVSQTSITLSCTCTRMGTGGRSRVRAPRVRRVLHGDDGLDDEIAQSGGRRHRGGQSGHLARVGMDPGAMPLDEVTPRHGRGELRREPDAGDVRGQGARIGQDRPPRRALLEGQDLSQGPRRLTAEDVDVVALLVRPASGGYRHNWLLPEGAASARSRNHRRRRWTPDEGVPGACSRGAPVRVPPSRSRMPVTVCPSLLFSRPTIMQPSRTSTLPMASTVAARRQRQSDAGRRLAACCRNPPWSARGLIGLKGHLAKG